MSEPGDAEPTPRWTPRRRALAVVVGALAFLAGVAIAAKGPLTRRLVKSRAAELGLELDFDDLEGGFSSLRVDNARVGLAGVRGLRVTAGTLTLATRWLTVTSAEARDVTVALDGSAGERVLELAAWSTEHPDAYRIPATASGVRVAWRARSDASPWLVMSNGSATTDGEHASFTAPTTAFGVPLGTVSARATVDAAGVRLTFGASAEGKAQTVEPGDGGLRPPNPQRETRLPADREPRDKGLGPPLRADLATNVRPPTLAITLRSVEVAALGAALGVTLPNRPIVASGRADLTLAAPPAGITGTASLELDGWVPQHPKVLDSILYGKKTQVRGRITLAEDRASARLDDLEVDAGKLALRGAGTLAPEERRTMLRVELAGLLPCSELARGTAANELPGFLGEIAGEVAHRAVGGSATVKVRVEAEVHDLANAKVTPTVSAGCALKLPGL